MAVESFGEVASMPWTTAMRTGREASEPVQVRQDSPQLDYRPIVGATEEPREVFNGAQNGLTIYRNADRHRAETVRGAGVFCLSVSQMDHGCSISG